MKNKSRLRLVVTRYFCILFLVNLGFLTSSADVKQISTEGRNIYRLAIAKADREGNAYRIVGSTYDDRVSAFDADGKHLWDHQVGGFIFDLACGDLDGDGVDEIAAASADGQVYVFDATGTLLWQFGAIFKGAPVWQVSIARLDGKTGVVVAGGVSRDVVCLSATGAQLATAEVRGSIRMLRTGDFDGDGADEVAVLPVRGQAQAMVFFKGNSLKLSALEIPSDKKFGSLGKANGTVGDLDGDGRAELVYQPGAFSVRDGFQQVVSFPPRFQVGSYDRHYNMRLLAVGNLTDEPGAEVVLLEGAEIRLLSSEGKMLGRAVASLGFTDVVYVPGDLHGSVLLGSSPNGDDSLYHLRFDSGWEKGIEGLRSNGAMARIDNNLRNVANDISDWQGKPILGQTAPYDVVVNHYWLTQKSTAVVDNWIAEAQAYRDEFPYSNLRFASCFWPGEDAPLLRPDGTPWKRDHRLAHDISGAEIVAVAKRFEEANCPFWVQVGHGCSPHLELDTIAEMLEVAPKTLLGFISAEDEKLDEIYYYFENHVKPILELCLTHKKKFIPRNKGVWWAHWAADDKLRSLIFNGRYRSVLIPSVEDSNTRTPDVNLAARVGLWLDGQVDDWACRSSADWFSSSRSWEWEYPLTGHPQLRYHVSQALLGAKVFMFLNGEREKESGNWTPVGIDGTGSFLHLLGKGIIASPKREQLRAISPVRMVVQEPSRRFASHGRNGHHLESWGADGSDHKSWPMDRLDTYWAMAPLPETDMSTYLWGRTSRKVSHIPTTSPHGFVSLLPSDKSQTFGEQSNLWNTNGDHLSKDGQFYELGEAREQMLVDLAEGAKQFPFRIEGTVFHQIVQQSATHYIIVLVDPGWLDPSDRPVTITSQLPGGWNIEDRLASGKLGSLDRPLTVTVPAGTFRLLDVWQQPEN